MVKEKWMQNLDLKKGSLRKALHVKEGKKIPKSKLDKASHSKNKSLKKKAILAKTFRKAKKS